MAIYDKWSYQLKILNIATAEDVERLEGRTPDEHDLNALRLEAYVVARNADALSSHTDRIYHIAYLRADGGIAEILDEIEKLHAPAGAAK
jgi:hypothetical protein